MCNNGHGILSRSLAIVLALGAERVRIGWWVGASGVGGMMAGDAFFCFNGTFCAAAFFPYEDVFE
jgi:hypothetical protein